MDSGKIMVFCGKGYGKSSAALGQSMLLARENKKTIVIHFLKAKNEDVAGFFNKLEPEIKVFRFEKSETCFNELSEEKKKEELGNIRSGLSFAKKVLATGECDNLVLDEVLGLVDEGIIEVEDIIQLLDSKSEDTSVILTGIVLPQGLEKYVDIISEIKSLR